MHVYLVGGAVRDQLLGHSYHEKITWWWVQPHNNYSIKVLPRGERFPRFSTSKTKEEYALARTERKSGTGYHGFNFSPRQKSV